jgi:glycosyltransferase involved in cell wall biosynthesis
MVNRITFFVNSAKGSIERRAVSLSRSLGERFAARLCVKEAYPGANKVWRIVRIVLDLLRERPHVLYVLDIGFSGVAVGALLKALTRARFVIDTGDAYFALMADSGKVGPLGLFFCRAVEQAAYALADLIVVRGSYHVDYLRSCGYNNVAFLPDGVDPELFKPSKSEKREALKKELGLEGFFSIGMLGALIWNEKYGVAYGWELPEAIALLVDLPVKGILVGAGDGLAGLKRRAEALGVSDRIRFLGWVEHEEIPRLLNAGDLWLSTQSNDLVGNVRTTGKLPEYMACGRPILATATGEARKMLPEEMLLEYAGVIDPGYPRRLADRVREILAGARKFSAGEELRKRALEAFDYRCLGAVLASRLLRLLDGEAVSRDSERAGNAGW